MGKSSSLAFQVGNRNHWVGPNSIIEIPKNLKSYTHNKSSIIHPESFIFTTVLLHLGDWKKSHRGFSGLSETIKAAIPFSGLPPAKVVNLGGFWASRGVCADSNGVLKESNPLPIITKGEAACAKDFEDFG